MSVGSVLRLVAAVAMIAALAACESAEERAEKHYQAALALIEAGDTERAMVELRNVFELNENHYDARRKLAALHLAGGNLRQAARNYLRLVEQLPDDLEGRVALAEIAFELRDRDEFVRHATAAEALDPEAPRVKAAALGRRYQEAVAAEDAPARAALVAEAEALLPELPENLILRLVIVDGLARDGSFTAALAELDRVIALRPRNRDFYDQRLAILAELDDQPAIEAQLKDMIVRFPEDDRVKATLIRYYLSRDDIDSAEAFLRSIADPKAVPPGAFIDLIRFLAELRGPEAARAEIERGIAENPDPVPFILLRAGLDFEAGKRDAAVAELEVVLKDSEASDQTRRVKVALARMQVTMGNQVGARRLVEEVLAEDATQVEALKMKAAWLVQDDDTDGAIATLRTALERAPEDAQALSMMAEAYTRAGSHDLARDYLALAAEASGNAPAESIRYAQRLIQEERYLPAEDVLLPALRLAPDDVGLLGLLGQLYLALDDQGRAGQVVETLRRIADDPAAAETANALEAALRGRAGGVEEALAFLEGLAAGEDADLGAKLALLRARLSAGQTAEALALAEELSAADPDSEQLRFALATARGAAGEYAGAEQIYRDLLAKDPARPRVWLQLAALKTRQGDAAAAKAVIDEGLAALPDDPDLLWAKAGHLERDGDIDGAIAIYEALYARSSGSVIVANNLASLLATWRDDQASLDRAWTVARRLNGTTVPALQDTYGWIAYRRGDIQEALPYLEGAAQALTGDPVVQYHLGMAYLKLDRKPEALARLRLAIEIAGEADARPQLAEARTAAAQLEAEGVVAAALEPAPDAPAPDAPAPEAPVPEAPAPAAPAPAPETPAPETPAPGGN